MKKQCQHIVNKGHQCTRTFKNSKQKLCWQHNPNSGVSILTKIAAIIGIIWGGYNIVMLFRPEQQFVCNPKEHIGCTLDLDISKSIIPHISVLGMPKSRNGKGVNCVMADFVLGQKKYPAAVPLELKSDDSIEPFNLIPGYFLKHTNSQIKSPFEIYHDGTNLLFNGKIYDYKTGELLGWFDSNEFETGNCIFTWNKDDNGVEIIDNYGNVAFSIDLQKGRVHRMDDGTSYQNLKVQFRGYFKNNDEYHIFGDSYNSTNNEIEAKKLMENIKPLFQHVGINSYGKRKNSI